MNVKIRVMEKKDLRDAAYGAKEMFEKYGHHGDYFFFVIEEEEEVIGYFIAKKEGKKITVIEIEVAEEYEATKAAYEKEAESQLYEYITHIKGCNAERVIFQVS